MNIPFNDFPKRSVEKTERKCGDEMYAHYIHSIIVNLTGIQQISLLLPRLPSNSRGGRTASQAKREICRTPQKISAGSNKIKSVIFTCYPYKPDPGVLNFSVRLTLIIIAVAISISI